MQRTTLQVLKAFFLIHLHEASPRLLFIPEQETTERADNTHFSEHKVITGGFTYLIVSEVPNTT